MKSLSNGVKVKILQAKSPFPSLCHTVCFYNFVEIENLPEILVAQQGTAALGTGASPSTYHFLKLHYYNLLGMCFYSHQTYYFSPSFFPSGKLFGRKMVNTVLHFLPFP